MRTCTFRAAFCLGAVGVLLASCGSSTERDFGDGTGGSGGSGGSGGTNATGGNGGGSGSAGKGGSATGGSAGSGGTSSGGSGGSGGACCTVPADPACQCVNCTIVAADADGDGHGTMDCAEAPGDDCDDSDADFIDNGCGGCERLTGTPGTPCGGCGTYECVGTTSLACVVPTPAPLRCTSNRVEECVNGQWSTLRTCSGLTPLCHQNACVECVPGTYKCETCCSGTDTVVIRCLSTAKWASSHAESCYAPKRCDPQQGACLSAITHPRDRSFEIHGPPQTRPALPHDLPGIPTEQVLDLASGFRFG